MSTPLRPAGLRCAPLAVATSAAAPAGNGRWRINSGARMPQVLTVDGAIQVVDAVLDLATVKIAKPALTCLLDHWGFPIGKWTDITITPTGPDKGIDAALTLYRTDADVTQAAHNLSCANMVTNLIAQDHPWEASIGEDPRTDSDYEVVARGTSVLVNGESITAAIDGPPLIIARNLTICEASIVTFGADNGTGRLAAALMRATSTHATTFKDPSMKTLKDLLAAHPEAHHGLIARLHADGKAEGEIATAIHAAIVTGKDAEIAGLKAEITQREATIAAHVAEIAALKGKPAVPAAGVQASASAPATAGQTPAVSDLSEASLNTAWESRPALRAGFCHDKAAMLAFAKRFPADAQALLA